MNVKDKVFVLSSVPYRGSDLVVNFLSGESGKLAAVLYGGKKLNKSSTFLYQPGDLIELEYEKSENKEFIKVYSSNGYSLLKIDQFPYQRFLFHTYLLEISSRISKPELAALEIYELLLENNRFKWGDATKVAFIAWSMWKIIQSGGYQVDFSHCTNCSKVTWRENNSGNLSFRKQRYRLDIQTGNIECGDCFDFTNDPNLLDSSMIKILWLYSQTNEFKNSPSSLPTSTLLPLIKVLNRYLLRCYEINPKSLGLFLQMIESIDQ